MSVTGVKPSSPSIAFDSDFTCGTGPKPGLPPKPMSPVVSPTQLQSILNANRGSSSAAASITPDSVDTNNPGPTQPTTSANMWETVLKVYGAAKVLDEITGGPIDYDKMRQYVKEKAAQNQK